MHRVFKTSLPLALLVTGALAVTWSAGAEDTAVDTPLAEGLAEAVFAGGCFWCVESDFDKLEGVVETTSGYTGGTLENPSYKQVTYTDTGHFEAVRIRYDPAVVEYATLVEVFFRTVDPTDDGGQFCDRGDSYRTAVFVATEAERTLAETAQRDAAVAISDQVVTPVLDAGAFWPAEGYHQDYYTKNPTSYALYRWRCGRDARVESIWGQDAEATIKAVNQRLPSG